MKDIIEPVLQTEISLAAEDIFYSRTDPRGVIISGNETCYRIAEYTPDELIGAPHKMLRHPDMPKAAFWIMWDMIQRGEPAAAYVKNRTKSGKFYWVLALVQPVAGGYLSVRIRPSSELFTTCKTIYAEQRDKELAEQIDAEASAHLLLERLKEAGFESYKQFMIAALRDEIAARLNDGAGEEHDFLDAHSIIRKDLEQLAQEQLRLSSVFQNLYLLPMNLRIMASRQSEAGGPISAVSESYRTIVGEISEMLSGLQSGVREDLDMNKSLDQALLDVTSLLIQSECAEAFEDEQEIGGQDQRKESKALNRITKQCARRARNQIADVIDGVEFMAQSCYNLRAEIARLDQVRVMGGVESRRLGGDPELIALMEQLRSFHVEIGQCLNAMITLADRLQSKARRCSG